MTRGQNYETSRSDIGRGRCVTNCGSITESLLKRQNSLVSLLCVMRKTLACDQAEVCGALSKGFAFPLENLGSAVTEMDSY